MIEPKSIDEHGALAKLSKCAYKIRAIAALIDNYANLNDAECYGANQILSGVALEITELAEAIGCSLSRKSAPQDAATS